MNMIISWISSVKLSLTQYLLITEAAVIGFLVILIRAKGTELHKAQLDALEANYMALKQAQDLRTSAAQQAYFKALKEYQENQK